MYALLLAVLSWVRFDLKLEEKFILSGIFCIWKLIVPVFCFLCLIVAFSCFSGEENSLKKTTISRNKIRIWLVKCLNLATDNKRCTYWKKVSHLIVKLTCNSNCCMILVIYYFKHSQLYLFGTFTWKLFLTFNRIFACRFLVYYKLPLSYFMIPIFYLLPRNMWCFFEKRAVKFLDNSTQHSDKVYLFFTKTCIFRKICSTSMILLLNLIQSVKRFCDHYIHVWLSLYPLVAKTSLKMSGNVWL